jgi:SPP1 family predicted phage head-tail adaptor
MQRIKNQRITLQRVSQSAGVNEFGEHTEDSWEDLEDRFCSILSKGFRELWRAGQQTLEATHLVELWFDSLTSSLSPETDRVIWRGRVLRILDVADEQNERKEILLVCRETRGMGVDE